MRTEGGSTGTAELQTCGVFIVLFLGSATPCLFGMMVLSSKERIICFCFIDYAKAFDCVDHNKLWKILKKMGIPDHLTCLLRNLYAGQEATVRTGHGTTDWFQVGKGSVKAVYCHPAYLTYMQSTS